MATFWRPTFVKEPGAFPSHSISRRADDMVGHSNLTLSWQGQGPHDDDGWRGKRPKREIAAPHDEKLYIFKPDDNTVAPNSKPFGGPRSFDDRDRTAAARRQELEAIPAAPPLTDRIKNSAGLWSWQQREVRLENRIIRKYSGPSPSKGASAHVQPFNADTTHLRPATSPRRQAIDALSPRRTSLSSPRRQEVKKRIMEMASKFGV